MNSQVPIGEGHGIGRCGHRKHEGVWSGDGGRNHEVKRMHTERHSLHENAQTKLAKSSYEGGKKTKLYHGYIPHYSD